MKSRGKKDNDGVRKIRDIRNEKKERNSEVLRKSPSWNKFLSPKEKQVLSNPFKIPNPWQHNDHDITRPILPLARHRLLRILHCTPNLSSPSLVPPSCRGKFVGSTDNCRIRQVFHRRRWKLSWLFGNAPTDHPSPPPLPNPGFTGISPFQKSIPDVFLAQVFRMIEGSDRCRKI